MSTMVVLVTNLVALPVIIYMLTGGQKKIELKII